MTAPVYPYLEKVKRTSELPSPVQRHMDKLTEKQLDDLEWAKKFLSKYEKKHDYLGRL
jgi:hypothetical protein